jgi:hypothetical protein
MIGRKVKSRGKAAFSTGLSRIAVSGDREKPAFVCRGI